MRKWVDSERERNLGEVMNIIALWIMDGTEGLMPPDHGFDGEFLARNADDDVLQPFMLYLLCCVHL